MTNLLTWEDVIKRNDLIGGDVEINDTDYIYRGPVKSIMKYRGWVFINMLWTGRRSAGVDKGWESLPTTTLFLANAKILPIDIGRGHVSFSRLPLGFGIFYPIGDSKLDPDKVKGLKI